MGLQFEEEKVLNGCRAGKPKYQKMLYEYFYGKMLSLCMRYAYNQEEAKDLLHEGYIKVCKNIEKIKGEGSLEGWVRRIMVNTAINHYHKNKKLQQNIYLETKYENIADNLSPQDNVFQKLAYEDLLKLVRTLTPAYRTVFNLYVIEGYNHKEIAEMLDISVGTSKSNLAKARYKLQEKIREWYNSESRADYVG